jgi:predicted GNAT family N-acyltransferase
MVNVRTISPKDTYELRYKVLWPHKTFDQCSLDIDALETTFHVGVEHEGKIVAVGTFLKQKNDNFPHENQYRLRAMASSSDLRGKGFGKLVIDFAKDKLKEMNIDLLWCDARLVAVPFYHKLGFKTKGEQYKIPIIGPHYLMYKEIK